jgi:hypothetical protein
MDTDRIPKQYQKQWLQHVQRMDTDRIPKQYQKQWLQHVQRVDTDRIPKQALQYRQKGRRNIWRPRKRWRDQLHLEENDNTPKPPRT